jgi:pimeloyl-ACP methyl ester carboxylesterase
MSEWRGFDLLSSDGIRLHARLYGEANHGTPIVCLPGLTRNADDFHALAVMLSQGDAARRVIVIEYRGRGDSEFDPDWRHYTVPVEAVDVRQMLKSLHVTEAIFLGTSRGGLITMTLKATIPSLVKAVILNDIGPVIEVAGLQRIASYVGKGSLPKDWNDAASRLKASNPDFTDLTDAEWHDFARAVYRETADGGLCLSYDPALSQGLAALDLTKPLPAAWPIFDLLSDVPLMVIRGKNSDLLSEGTVEEMTRRHPALVRLDVPNEGHAPFVGRPKTSQAIAKFIRGSAD